ncbi:S-layer homology domain-containing protein [Sporosarcina sp.]|uniref:S-layer homology domain-containing protein n=1 Tax=Sporosarcina sp. TaxID=49982 RepID=UPI00262B4736|nr:S-layer homology domain-containing protein [Sporosarcina sp.]
MYKRLLLSMITLFALALLIVPTVNAASFKDVPYNHSNYGNINYLVDLQIIKGYEDGTFGPNNPVTNRQAAVMLVRALGLTEGATVHPGYQDVPEKDGAYREIAIAANAGLFPVGGHFNPGSYITRESMARALTNAFDLKGNKKTDFTDVTASYWAYAYIDSLAANQITTGFSDGSFKPKQSVTRSHFASFLVRAIDPSKRPGEVNKPLVWSGNWERTIHNEKGYLTIESVRNNSFEFSLTASSGTRAGFIEGKALISGNKAKFSTTEYGELCKLEMTLSEQKLQITQSPGCSIHGGAGVSFGGEYLNDTEISKFPPKDLSSLEIVSSDLDMKIKRLTGEDYAVIVESMHIVSGDYNIGDIWGKQGFLRGMYWDVNSVIGWNPKGHLYVATVVGDMRIKFYTDDPSYKNSIPGFIQDWYESFEDYSIENVYKHL